MNVVALTNNTCIKGCQNLKNRRRDCIASEEECLRILDSCRKSHNSHFFLVFLTTITMSMCQRKKGRSHRVCLIANLYS